MSRSPVLLIAFNRPDFAAETIRVIVEQRPPLLYVACDGPRDEAESAVVEQTRHVIMEATEGVVDVRTLFRPHNLGCKRGVESAISWFFSEQTEGIVLEDDCVPSPAFFDFADEMLERYRPDSEIMHISGYCNSPSQRAGHRFSRFPAVWGWATWRRAWEHYPETLPEMTSDRRRALRGAFATSEELDFFVDKWVAVRGGRLDTWDFSWCFAVMANRGLAVQPYQNLVRNTGVGDPRAAHTTRSRSGAFDHVQDPPLADLLTPPEFRVPDFELDSDYFARSIAGRLRAARRIARRFTR